MMGFQVFALLYVFSIPGIQAFPVRFDPAPVAGDNSAPAGCTVITVSKGDRVFFGGNDDYILADSYYWVQPGDSSRYGVIWIGRPDNPQQGINEKGLAYDANGLPRVDLKTHPGRQPAPAEYHLYCMQILHECATVEEVIDWAGRHQHLPYMHDQMHFADAGGDAVIISAGADGEMAFTRKPEGDGYLVSTNFNVANTANNYGYPCWRYTKARELLDPLIETAHPLRLEDVTAIMDAVHVERGSSWTISTLVADLAVGDVYLYFFFQYDRPLVLNVHDELAHPREPGPLSALFPQEVQEEAARRYRAARANLRTNRMVGIGWPVVLAISLLAFLRNRQLFRKGFGFWLTAVLLLGPLALAAGYITLKRCRNVSCQHALVETLGNLMPVVLAYTAGITWLVLSMLSGQAGWQVQVAVMFGLPFLFGLAFHAAFLAPASRMGFWPFLVRCVPLVLITTCLGLGGMMPVALPLVNKSLNLSLLMPLSPLPPITWWAIAALGALPGGALILLFQRRAVQADLRLWAVRTGAEGEMRFPAWGKLWWWFPAGIAVLLAGLIAGVLLLK